MNDVVLILGPDSGRSGSELKYALRGLEAFVPHNRVVVLGHKPEWVQNVLHIETKPVEGKWYDLDAKFLLLHTLNELTEEVIYTEDDYIVTKPLEDGVLPNYYKDTLEERLVNTKGGHWHDSLAITCEILQEEGIRHPISFDLHIPMVVRRSEIPIHLDHRYRKRWRSLYGNMCSAPPKKICRDVKATTKEDLQDIIDLDLGFLSTADNTWKVIGAETYLKTLFPSKSKYER